MRRDAAVAGAPPGPAEDLHAPLEIGPGEPPPTGRGQHRRRPAGSQRERCAVGYLRRSTDRQEQSIPDQKRAVEAYCAQHGLRLLRCYTDDGISGTSTAGRHAFAEMVQSAQSPACDFGVIVAYDVKRFGRIDNDEAGYWRHLLRQHGVQVRYAAEGFSGDGTDDLLRPVKQWQAREESKDLSKVTIRGLLSKSTTGHWMGGAPPFGYDLRYESQSGQFLLRLRYHTDGTKAALDDQGRLQRTLARGESLAVSRKDRCRLVPGEPSRVETVRRIFRMYAAEGRGFKAIADALNREGVPTARGPAWAGHYSGQWAMSTVRAILVNPAYAGDMAWNRRTDARFHRIERGRAVLRAEVLGRRLEPNSPEDWVIVRDAHEPLVDRRLFDEAQRRLAEKPASAEQRGINPRTGAPVAGRNVRPVGGWSGPRARFLLSGLCSCVRCSSRYEGYTNRSGQKNEDGSRDKWHTYACGAAIRRGPSVCRLGQVRQEILEEAVVGAVLGYYGRFMGRGGAERLREAAEASLGDQHERARRERELIAQRLEAVEGTIRNLLDNITAANRELVDERIGELARERETLRSRAEELGRLSLSQEQIRSAVGETGRFLAALERTLREGSLAERQAVVRRCVQRVWVDHEGGRAQIELLVLPAVAWRAEGAATERVEMGLA